MPPLATLSAPFPIPVQAAAREAGIDPEALVLGLWQAGRAAWPDVDVPPSSFAAHLCRHWPADLDPIRSPSTIRAGDLYLACGCSLGLPAALSALDREILSQVPRFL